MKNIDKHKDEIMEYMKRSAELHNDYTAGLDCFLNSLLKDGKCRHYHCEKCFMESLEMLAQECEDDEE